MMAGRDGSPAPEPRMKINILVCLSLITLVLVLNPDAQAQTFSVIHTFNWSDGSAPFAGPTLRGGALYGTTNTGGDSQYPSGAVYAIHQTGSQWVGTSIYLFNDPNGPYNPQARVMFGPDGHLYSTTHLGVGHDDGTVFQLIPPPSICKTANCFWKQTVLHSFVAEPDGSQPDSADIAFDPQGNIYGTTRYGGSPQFPGGIVYEMQYSGNTWTENILFNFTSQQTGYGPAGGVIRDKDGNLFGTTIGGGPGDFGTVYELSNIPGVGWTETVLYNFQNGSDGAAPWGGLVMDSSGNLYGTTVGGGSGAGGTIFELSPSGNTWTFNVLYSISGANGGGPHAALALDSVGNLYGTTIWQGAHKFYGNVFKLTNTGNGWTYTSLHDFTGGADGGYPYSSVAIDTDGTLYGTASAGGSFQGNCSHQGCGVVWMIKP